MEPTFSVIVMAYKRKEYILSAINSILIQTYPKELIEIIVVKAFNDKRIDDFLSKQRIKSIFNDDYSNGASLVEGIKASNNEILCLLDDDDIFHPTKLTEIAQAFQKFPDVDLFLNGYTVIRSSEEETNFLHSMQKEDIEPIVVMQNDMYKKNTSNNLFFNTSRYSFRKKWVPELSEFLSGIPYSVDTLLTYFFIVRGSIGYAKKNLNAYRIHDNNISIMKVSNFSLIALDERTKKHILSIEFFLNYFKTIEHEAFYHLQLKLYSLKIQRSYILRDKKSVILGAIFIAVRFYVITFRRREKNKYLSSKYVTLVISKSIFLFPLFVVSPRTFRLFYFMTAQEIIKYILG